MTRRRLLSSTLLVRGVVAGVLAVGLVMTSVSVSAVAAPATGPGQVLILGSTVTGGAGSIEAQEVTAQGLTPVVVDDATWSGLSTADFASYRALIIGDPTCSSSAPTAAVNNASTWGPAVTGSVLINGTDPVYHADQGGRAATQRFVDFAVSNTAKTGAYLSLSCNFQDTAAHTPVPLLDALRPGGFTVTGVGCYNDAHVVATQGALNGLSDTTLSNWSCSVHEAFDSYPPDYQVLAIARNIGSVYTASDGSVGTPYILASGVGLRSFPLSLSPPGDSAPEGGSHTVTAQLVDKTTSLGVANLPLVFRVSAGPDVGAVGTCSTGAGCLTGPDGQVSWTYQNTSGPGVDTIQTFLDANNNGQPDSGEYQTSAGMTWTTDSAPPDTYAAMGDSFQSGEGAYNYKPGTDVPSNKCHQSLDSYPYLITGQPAMPSKLVDVACSGAVILNLDKAQNPTQDPQYAGLSERDALVTIGIGGNDLKFPSVIADCVTTIFHGDFFDAPNACAGRLDQQVTNGIAVLRTPSLATGLSPLQTVYNTVRLRAPRARIVVVGYPHFFTPGSSYPLCAGMLPSDQLWINSKVDEFDNAIRAEALSMGAEYAGGAHELAGHELCDASVPYFNGINPGTGDNFPAYSESFHPNKLGQAQIANVLLGHIQSFTPTTSVLIAQGQTITTPITITLAQAIASFYSHWPGSDVEMTLTDPTGRVYTRAAPGPGVFHTNGATSELFKVDSPAPGVWTVSLYGAHVKPGGEPVDLTVNQLTAPNLLPVPSATAQPNAAGTTVSYDASASRDPDGTIASYEWIFGDGTVGTGKTISHTYSNLGHLDQPALIVTDNGGAQGFLDLPAVKVHYGFDGFRPPISATGTMTANAGRTLPFKWALTDPAGNVVTATSAVVSGVFDAAGATYDLKVVGSQYMLQVNTPRSWAGTLRMFTLKLDDQSVHTVAVQF